MNVMEVSLTLIIILLGLYIGCFINPIIYYLPKLTKVWLSNDLQDLIGSPVSHEKIIINTSSDRGACKNCSHINSEPYKLSLISLIKHKGRCENCSEIANFKRPLVEVTCCLVTLGVISLFGFDLYAIFVLLFGYSVIIIIFTDLEHHLVPNTIIMPLIWAGLILSITGHSNLTPSESILGAVLGYVAMWILAKACQILSKSESMGKGDFKIMAAFGAWFGTDLMQTSLLLAFLIPAIYLIISKKGKKQEIAFGPYIALGWFVTVFYHNFNLSGNYLWLG